MSYLSLARKYRPQEFDEIIGQEHVSSTLRNAVTMDRAAHAYLFAGPRGVGKTSTARILAKSLNCEKGPTPNPCGKCAACKEITSGISMDVIEIDGASNRGIDEIRNLKENVKFASARGKYKIYIIDEVHMLTQEAFNALLKTLEEPPVHVKFIFATTRPYKVLPTIISRCQRFDFRKITSHNIAKKLEDIRKIEKLKIKDEAIFLIAKAADGSMRDAEVILDQILSFTKSEIKPEDVSEVLGLLEQDTLFGIADSIINNEKNRILEIVNELINGGKDPVFITTSVINHFRNLMVAKLSGESKSSSRAIPEEDYHKLEEQGRKFSLDEILYITYTLSATIDLIKKTSLSRIPLEISLIKLTERAKIIPISEILKRLSTLEVKLKQAPSLGKTADEVGDLPPTPKPATSEVKSAPSEPPVIAREVAAEKDILLLQKIKTSWGKILNLIKNKKMSLATFLSDGRLLKLKDDILVIGFRKTSSLHKEAVESDVNKKFIEEMIKTITGEDILLNTETVEEETLPEPETPLAGEDASEDLQDEKQNAIEPIVESAIDIFDGRIIDVREKRKERK